MMQRQPPCAKPTFSFKNWAGDAVHLRLGCDGSPETGLGHRVCGLLLLLRWLQRP